MKLLKFIFAICLLSVLVEISANTTPATPAKVDPAKVDPAKDVDKKDPSKNT